MRKIAVCIDKRGGVMFNHRRVSQDADVRNKLMELIGTHRLFMSTYSAKQFDPNPRIYISDTFLEEASDEDVCFIEDVDISIDDISEIYLFHWNRDYPADTHFHFDPKECGFKRIKKEDFEGSTHPKITLEIYRRIN